jgi:hypothetical protein
MGGQQGIAGHRRSHLAVAQDEVRENREHRFARGALKTPDGDPTEPDPDIMRVARQAPASAIGRFMFQLKAKRQEKGENTFEKRLAFAKQAPLGGFILEIDGDGAVFSRRFGRCAHVLPPGHQVA